ncbi:MAG: DUF4358 domain-containing protein [Ruminococcus sp.]|nr:DUF4358 domain-containing protein [Ruminococcus sp.]MCD7801291.1 DUF4358 domain-containing protein [Ruminococcus sp.]
MMKRLTLWLLISCIATSFIACEQNDATDTQDTTTQLEETTILESETTEEDVESFESESSNEENQNLDLMAIVDEITSKEEWASLAQIEDDDLINEYFTLEPSNSNYKQLLVMQCPMSAVIAEIILIQAEDTDSAMQDLQARKDKLINTDTYYPEHKEIAESSIIGSYDDLVYFIAGENAENSEKILTDYLDSLS